MITRDQIKIETFPPRNRSEPKTIQATVTVEETFQVSTRAESQARGSLSDLAAQRLQDKVMHVIYGDVIHGLEELRREVLSRVFDHLPSVTEIDAAFRRLSDSVKGN